MLAHLFDRFYIVTKFILPSIGDLNFSTLNYDNTCAYLENKNVCNTESKKHMLDLMTFCKKIEPFVLYYKRLIKSYNNMAHNILENKINLYIFDTRSGSSINRTIIFSVQQAFTRSSTMASSGVRENVHLNTKLELSWKILIFII